MGTALRIFNTFGFTGLFFGFITNWNVNPLVSLAIGFISTVWAFFKMLKMGEDWLYRRAERKLKDLEAKKEKDADYKREQLRHKKNHHE